MINVKIGDTVWHPYHGEGRVVGYPMNMYDESYVFFYKLNKRIKIKNVFLSGSYHEAQKDKFTQNIRFGLDLSLS